MDLHSLNTVLFKGQLYFNFIPENLLGYNLKVSYGGRKVLLKTGAFKWYE